MVFGKKPTKEEEPHVYLGGGVLYTGKDGLTWPAIVSEIDLMKPSVLGLTVFAMAGPRIADVVPYDADGACNSWRWPGDGKRS